MVELDPSKIISAWHPPPHPFGIPTHPTGKESQVTFSYNNCTIIILAKDLDQLLTKQLLFYQPSRHQSPLLFR